jgi:undecaprenyl-diphosphatase
MLSPTNHKLHAEGKIGFLATALFFTGLVGVPILLAEMYLLPTLEAGALLSLMGAGLVLTGFMLTMQHRNRWRHAEAASWKDGVLTGALQGLSTIPGVSRAGATTTALIWRGFDAESSFHLSFLLSIPTVFLAEVVLWAAQGGVSAIPIWEGLTLSLCSFAFGYLTIHALIKVAHKINVAWLAFVFGMMMLAFGLLGIG